MFFGNLYRFENIHMLYLESKYWPDFEKVYCCEYILSITIRCSPRKFSCQHFHEVMFCKCTAIYLIVVTYHILKGCICVAENI
jgi:hypothetical protein